MSVEEKEKEIIPSLTAVSGLDDFLSWGKRY